MPSAHVASLRGARYPVPRAGAKPDQARVNMSKWYYRQAGRTSDALSEDELIELLRARKLAPATEVWKDGMQAWVRADSVPILARALRTPAESAPPSDPAPTGDSTADAARGLRAEPNPTRGIALAVVTMLIVALVIWCAQELAAAPPTAPTR